MSEGGTHTAIARARAGVVATTPGAPSLAERAAAILATVPDPELPVVSLVDLGIVHGVAVDGPEGGLTVTILPTFIGCPALDVMATTIEEALAPLGVPVRVETSFVEPWTSERITARGRAALLAAGIAPPDDPAAIRCPHCASEQVVQDSAFGPTQCRTLWYCRACRQPFEAMKPI